jgi:hypothetical protein
MMAIGPVLVAAAQSIANEIQAAHGFGDAMPRM